MELTAQVVVPLSLDCTAPWARPACQGNTLPCVLDAFRSGVVLPAVFCELCPGFAVCARLWGVFEHLVYLFCCAVGHMAAGLAAERMQPVLSKQARAPGYPCWQDLGVRSDCCQGRHWCGGTAPLRGGRRLPELPLWVVDSRAGDEAQGRGYPGFRVLGLEALTMSGCLGTKQPAPK